MFRNFVFRWKTPLFFATISFPTLYYLRPHLATYLEKRSLNEELQATIHKYGESDESLAHIYERLGSLYKEEAPQLALENFEKAMNIYDVYGFSSAKVPEEDFYKKYGELLLKEGHEKRAQALFEKSLDSRANKATRLDPSFISEYHFLGSSYQKGEEYDRAIQCLEKALEVEAKLEAPAENQLVSDVLKTLGDIYYQKGVNQNLDKSLLQKAHDYYKRALARLSAQAHSSVSAAKLYYDLGKTDYYLNKLDQSSFNCERSLQILKDHDDKLNPEFAHCSSILASDFIYQSKNDIALPLLEQSIATYKQLQRTPIEEENYARALANFGVINSKLKKPQQAIENLKESISIMEKVKGNRSLEALEMSFNLALILSENGHRIEAMKLASDLYENSRKEFGDGFQLTQNALQLLTGLTS